MKKLLFGLLMMGICAVSSAAEPKANAIRITDAGSYYTGTSVEAALQELGAGTIITPPYLTLAAPNQTVVQVPNFSNGLNTTKLNTLVVVDGTTYARTNTGIANALTVAGTGGSVFLTDGTYDITAAVSSNSNNVTLFGGKGAILKLVDSTPNISILKIYGSTSHIYGFTIDGNNAGQAGVSNWNNLQIMAGADNTVVENMYFYNSNDSAVSIEADNVRVTNNTFLNNVSDAMASSSRGGIKVKGDYFYVAGNYIYNSPTGIAIGVDGSYGTIEGNTISGIDLDSSSCIHVDDTEGIVITGNNLRSTAVTTNGINGIFVRDADASISNSIVSNNRIENISGVGIEFQGGKVLCSNNWIKLTNGGAGTSGDQHGIYISGSDNDVEITKN